MIKCYTLEETWKLCCRKKIIFANGSNYVIYKCIYYYCNFLSVHINILMIIQTLFLEIQYCS